MLSWGSEPQATGFNIYWSNGYRAVFLGTVGASTTSVTITGLRTGSGAYFLVEAFNSVTRADSQWVYVATPFSTIGSNAAFGQYAEQQSSNAGVGGSTAPSVVANANGHHWWRE